jgi:hypothetical protein
MIDYSFYIKQSPVSKDNFKIGISAIKNMDVRLGSYQNAIGPGYQERFECIWVGPEEDIRELERLLKIKFKSKMAGTYRGYTEWVTDIQYNDLVTIVDNTILELGVEATTPSGLGNIFLEDVEQIKETYLIEGVHND